MKRKCLPILITVLLLPLLLFGCDRAGAPETAPAVATATPEPQTVAIVPISEETPTPPPVPMPTPTPEDPLRAKNGAYTIAWLSDTQHYSRLHPEYFHAQTRFLADNIERLNLQYIVHTGDLVHNQDDEAQWHTADGAMRTIDDIPYGVLPGNHDVFEGDSAAYSEWFGEARMADKPWYGAGYRDNAAHYDLIDVGNTAYLFVYVGFNMDDAMLRFANEAFEAHRDRVGILCVHAYFNSDCTLTDHGKTLLEHVVKANPNLYMVLCGHRYNCRTIPITLDDDGDGANERTVLQCICNYQAAGDEGGDGYFRLMQVDERAGIIRFYNYSPVHDDFVYHDTEEHRAEKYAFDPADEQGSVAIPWPIKDH